MGKWHSCRRQDSTATGRRTSLAIDEVNGVYQASGVIDINKGCSEIYRSIGNPDKYIGQVFVELLKRLGVKVGQIQFSPAKSDERVLFTHSSKPLSQILWDLNHYSTNFIAEQLVFALGEMPDGRYSYEQGLKFLKNYSNKLLKDHGKRILEDGSGLSHNNLIEPALITQVLTRMYHKEMVFPEFESSLSVSNRAGTLKKRKFGNGILVRGKTGTLTGVRALAGYVYSKTGHRYAFAILQNEIKSGAAADKTENNIIQAIYENG